MAFYPPQGSCQELALTTSIQLDYPYSADTENVTITDMIDVSATSINLNIFLPDSTLTSPGFAITFNNIGSNSFNIVLNDQVTLLTAIAPSAIVTIYLYDNSVANGSWRIIPFGGGVNAISTLNLTSTDQSITVTNGSITPPGGTINVSLPTIVSALQNLTTSIPGVLVINNTNPLLWSVVSLTSGSNITVTTPDGSTGNPVIGLNSNVSVTQLTAGNIVINNDLITNTDTNGILSITSLGTTSLINLNSVLIDVSGNLTVNDLTVQGTFSGSTNAQAWCRFSNKSGSISFISVYNVDDITYSSITNQYTIIFENSMSNINYGVFISCSNSNSTPPLQTRIGYDISKQLGSVTIVLADAAGEILTDVPDGVSVMIFSLN